MKAAVRPDAKVFGFNRTALARGRFIFRRGLSQEEFEFACSVDLSSGRVRNVELHRW